MTSIVDTSVKLYTSDMANAPALTNTSGSLVALLDAVLKDGFDVKSITSLTVVAGVATLTWTGSYSAIPNAVILVSGVTGGPAGFDGMNGEQKVQTKPSASSCTFLTALPDGSYTGTITIKIAPLGWEKPFADTNKAAYRSADVASTGMFLRVDDNYGGSGGARVVGMETMTGIDTGTGRFPMPSQSAGLPEGGGWWPKADANVQPAGWVIVGDGRTFFMHVSSYVSNGPFYDGYILGGLRGFGDMIALRPGGDAYACALGAMPGASPSSYPTSGGFESSSNASFFMPRDWTGVGTSQANYSIPYTGTLTMSGMDQTLGNFPSRVDGSMRLSRKYLNASPFSMEPRCDVPGVVHVPQNRCGGLPHKSIYPGSGALSGRKLLGLIVSSNGGATVPTPENAGIVLVDVTGPWR